MNPRLVVLAADIDEALTRATAVAFPHEMVGLLAGHREERTLHVERFVRLTDAACGADHFTVPPAAFAAAEAAIRRTGGTWLGFVHSHPHGTASLSTRDRSDLWRGCLQLIVAPLRHGSLQIAAFWLEHDRKDTLPLTRALAAAAR